MYYVIHNNPNLLHQTNDDINKVYEINQPILTVVLLFRYSLYKFSSLFSPNLVQKTHVLFKYDKKMAIKK